MNRMVTRLVKTKVRPASVNVILLGLALLLIVNILARFNIGPNFTPFQADILTIVGALFLLSEVAAMQIFAGRARKGGDFVIDVLILIIGGVALVGAVAGLFGVQFQLLQGFKGLVDAGLLIFILVEIFR